jgi:hypothetical protein
MRLMAPDRDEVTREIALMRLVTVLSIVLSVALPLAAAIVLGG